MGHPFQLGLAWIGLAAALCLAVACSFSNSSESSSDSSTSSSDSSKSSSGEEAAHFREDVERYTAALVKAWEAALGSPPRAVARADRDELFSGLGDVARGHGISDWEAEPGVWEAMGRGLAQAEVAEAQRRAYTQAWAGGDPERQHAIERGCEGSR